MARNIEFNLEIDPSINAVFDEVSGSNSFLALRRLKWTAEGSFKLDIRKWYTNSNGEEVAGKGVSFMTDEGPANLVKALLENGYGDTMTTLEGIKDRSDFLQCVKQLLTDNNMDIDSVDISNLNDADSSMSFYDPKSILL